MYPDGRTVFGTGWEITDVGTYSVVSKSGFVPGYSVGFAFVPEFKLGLYFCFLILFLAFASLTRRKGGGEERWIVEEGGREEVKKLRLSPISWKSHCVGVNRTAHCFTESRYKNRFKNHSTGAVVLVSGREIAWRVAQSIVDTLAKTMDALLFRQQLQVTVVDNE